MLLQLKKEEHIEQSKCQRVKVLELAQGASIKSVESSKSRINVSEYHHLLFSHHEPRWRGAFGEEKSLTSYSLRCTMMVVNLKLSGMMEAKQRQRAEHESEVQNELLSDKKIHDNANPACLTDLLHGIQKQDLK